MRLIAALCLAAAPAAAQTPVWHLQSYFQPQSHTAVAISGPLAVGERVMFFGPSKPVRTQSLGLIWRDWDGIRGKETAELFRLSHDPGALLNGNTLCGNRNATYAAIYETREGLGMSVFSGNELPSDHTDPRLCGTFYYYAD